MIHRVVADLGFSKKNFWFFKESSSELVEKKKRLQPDFFNISEHIKSNLACNNCSGLTHCACIAWRIHSFVQKRGMALPSKNFSFIASSCKIQEVQISKGVSVETPESTLDLPLLC